MKRPLSMTSFGRGESVADGTAWTVEIRTVNHRYCDINFKLPRKYAVLEDRMKKEIMSFYSRGHIDVMLSYVSSEVCSANLAVNLELAREYQRSLRELSEALSLPESVDLAQVAGYKDVIVAREPDEDIDTIWPAIRTALLQALEEGQAMRGREGATLKDDLLARLHTLETTADAVEKQAPDLIRKKEAALKERLDNLLKGVDIDPARLAQEVAVMADKADVTEELVRLRSHCKQFSHFLELDEPVGRRLDFLMQEFLREINTMASKINDAGVAHLSVELKNEVEKMREQVQNLE